AARQDSGDAARRAPRGGNPGSRAGSAGSDPDNRAQRIAAVMSHSGEEQTAVSENSNGSRADNQPPEVIGVRRGMFGAKGSGDTSGYGRLVRPVALPGSSPRPYRGHSAPILPHL